MRVLKSHSPLAHISVRATPEPKLRSVFKYLGTFVRGKGSPVLVVSLPLPHELVLELSP